MLNNISYLFIQSDQSSDNILSDQNTPLEVLSPTFGDDTTTQIRDSDSTIYKTKCYIHNIFEPRFLSLVYLEDFEPNVSNAVTDFVGQLLNKFPKVAVREWLTYVYEHNLNKPIILKAILYIIIYYPELFDSNGVTIALASVSNKSCEIQELSIRVFENYCTETSYQALCSIKNQEPWLQKYIDKVKHDIKSRICQ